MRILPCCLRFEDVDPRTHRFDEASAREVIAAIVEHAVSFDLTRKNLAKNWDLDRLQAAIDQALIDRVGAWATGFSWAASEPGGGGPVRRYCCPRDSLLRRDDADAQASIERVVEALRDWRSFLVEMTERFDLMSTDASSMSLERSVEHVAAALLPFVLERTGAEDAWYETFATIVLWYLESRGIDRARVGPIVTSTISGRFQSWVAPGSALAEETIAELAFEVALAEEVATNAAASVDGFAEWRGAREKGFVNAAYPWTIPIAWDGHRRYIEGTESKRDATRARLMLRALEACRASARANEALTFERLARFQSLALGRDVGFREADAFAKAGRERYPLEKDTRREFERWLEESNDRSVPFQVRAARVYLDVCFAHPFDDGNARAARLALDHVLMREGLVLRAVEPLFVLSRAANDAEGARSLSWLIGYFAGRESE